MAVVLGILASLVGPEIELGKCIIPPIKRQFSYLCCFNSHIESLKDEAKNLEEARAGLQMRVDEAERNAQVIVPAVETWLTNANKEIQVYTSGIKVEISNVQSGCSTIISRFSLSKKARKTADAMKELLRRGCTFDHISAPPPPPAATSNPSGQTYEFESRRLIEEAIMEALRDNKVNILGICGMGGVGKTTMAKRIMNRVRDEGLFGEVVIIVVGQQPDMIKIQCEISELLGLKLKEETLPGRAEKLRLRLEGTEEGTKRILIVVDDIWKEFKLEAMGITCKSAVEGRCTVLLTSRDKDALKDTKAQKVYEIETLSEREARLLFEEKSGICQNDSNRLSIAKKIAKECKGLPIALITVAGALKDIKDKRVWDDALQQLKDHNPIDMPHMLGVSQDHYGAK